MANVTITKFKFTSLTPTSPHTIGEAIVAGQLCYKLADKLMLADCTDATKTDARYVATSDGDADGDVVHAVDIINTTTLEDTGTPFTVGAAYVLSATSGRIAPIADLASTNKLVVLGYGSATNQIRFKLDNTGIAIP